MPLMVHFRTWTQQQLMLQDESEQDGSPQRLSAEPPSGPPSGFAISLLASTLVPVVFVLFMYLFSLVKWFWMCFSVLCISLFNKDGTRFHNKEEVFQPLLQAAVSLGGEGMFGSMGQPLRKEWGG